jgi:iron complex outermembrane receptor protein
MTRAVRTPSRVETDYTTVSLVSAAIPAFVRLEPNPDFTPETLVAYELGYRVRPHERLFVTASGFYNDFQHALSTELLSPFVERMPPDPARLILPVEFGNGLHGSSYGGELTGDIRPYPWWRITANYSFLKVVMTRNPGGHDVSQEATYEGRIPHHQLQAGTSFDLARVEVDYLIRYISELQAVKVQGYSASTFRIGWHAAPHFDLALVGQDLFSDHHLEWPSAPNVEIERSVYGSVTWRR